ncbi:hypothetical protein GCM10025868_06070 [Angustibacter aerolatus]|uniref:Tetratricopeptide repeat protein n=1 Tax=Angustibacter aerolatus TaxID=1162965 RepID=A0ABQ6JC56_9ACTN|nr:hypothetical protein GCM10025868_06070 [Angustibacter aerolatus]
MRLAPDSHYGHFALGLSLTRVDRFERGAEHLAMAATMQPGRAEYVDRLRQARATLRARADLREQTEREPGGASGRGAVPGRPGSRRSRRLAIPLAAPTSPLCRRGTSVRTTGRRRGTAGRLALGRRRRRRCSRALPRRPVTMTALTVARASGDTAGAGSSARVAGGRAMTAVPGGRPTRTDRVPR